MSQYKYIQSFNPQKRGTNNPYDHKFIPACRCFDINFYPRRKVLLFVGGNMTVEIYNDAYCGVVDI